jgi:hypothetical protein
MKIAELEGAALDYWVAQAGEEWKMAHKMFPTMTLDPTFSGVNIVKMSRGLTCQFVPNNPFRQDYQIFEPSQAWEHGGPIIEREGMRLSRTSGRPEWHALTQGKQEENCTNFHMGYGPTPLIAAMRAFVASKFGDEVPDIKETA